VLQTLKISKKATKRAEKKKHKYKRRQNFITRKEILNGTLLLKTHLKVVGTLNPRLEKKKKVMKMRWKKERMKYGTSKYLKER
jgi:hypothetical protein